MANSVRKHVNLSSIGTASAKTKTGKKKIRKTSKKVAKLGRVGGALPKLRKIKRAAPKKGKK